MKFDPDEFMRKVFEDVESVSSDKAERMATGHGETACRNRCAMYGSIRKNFISELGIVTGRARPRGALQLGRRNRLRHRARRRMGDGRRPR